MDVPRVEFKKQQADRRKWQYAAGAVALVVVTAGLFSLEPAADADEQRREVVLRWRPFDTGAMVEVIDQGPGIANPDNLFVPFFTTKPGGSGIGLVLSRQIVEGHGGSLTLENRRDRSGCIARVVLG